VPRLAYVLDELKSSGPYVSMRELHKRYTRGDMIAPTPTDELSTAAGDQLYTIFRIGGADPHPELPALGFELDELFRLRGLRIGYRPTDLRPHYELIRARYRVPAHRMDQIRCRGGSLLTSFAHTMTTFNPDEVRELAASSKRTFDTFAARCNFCAFAVQDDFGGEPQILVAGQVPMRAATHVRLGGRWHDLPLW
jgi:hypothetical protein